MVPVGWTDAWRRVMDKVPAGSLSHPVMDHFCRTQYDTSS
jgi:hypothetical protein